MGELHLVKLPNGRIEAVGSADISAWECVKVGQEFTASIRLPRNPSFHRFAWSIVDIAADNWPGDERPKPVWVMRWLKKKTGLVEYFKNLETGETECEVKSIRWDAMGEEVFHPWFYDEAVPAIAKALGVTPEDLLSQLKERPLKRKQRAPNTESKGENGISINPPGLEVPHRYSLQMGSSARKFDGSSPQNKRLENKRKEVSIDDPFSA